ncbi:MAG: hypothetical protein ACHREM_16580 [Polyangiales bacterium]
MSDGPTSSSEVDLAAERRARNLKVGGVFALIIVGAAAGLFVLDKNEKRATQQKLDATWSALAKCLVSDADASTPPSVGFRAVQLTAMGLDEDARREPGALPWPQSCAKHAYALSTALQNSARAKKDARDLAAIALGFGKQLESTKDAIKKNQSEAVDELFAAAKAEALTAGPSDVYAPPTPAKARTLASFADFPRVSKSPFSSKAVQLETHRGAVLRFVVDDKTLKGGPWACAFEGTPLKGTCTKAPDSAVAVNAPLRLSATHLGRSAPLWIAGDSGMSGVFRGDTGAKVGAPLKFGWATIDAAGVVEVLGWDDSTKKLRLDRQPSDGAIVSTIVTPPYEVGVENLYYAGAIVGDVVLWRGAKEKLGLRHVFAQTILPPSSPLGLAPPIDLGEFGDWYPQGDPRLRACLTAEDNLFLDVDGTEGDHLAMRVGGTWSPPIELQGAGVMTCQGKSMQLTRVGTFEHTISVTQTRCANGDCVPTNVKLKLPDALTPQSVRAVELADKIALVYADSDRGGVRVRIGTLKELDHAKDVILYDDHVDATTDAMGDGKRGAVSDQSNLYDVAAYSAGDVALVLLSTKQGVVPIAIDASGAVSKVAMTGSF